LAIWLNYATIITRKQVKASKRWLFRQPKDEKESLCLFQSRLDQILNLTHSLYKLSRAIDWSVFESELLLKETIEAARRCQVLKRSDLKRVNADTTVQEKAIAFPTDSGLNQKMRVKAAGDREIKLRQSYVRKGSEVPGHAKPLPSRQPT
jgi:hypothetical protein